MLELDGTQHLKVFGTKAGERPFLAPYRPEIDVTKVLGVISNLVTFNSLEYSDEQYNLVGLTS